MKNILTSLICVSLALGSFAQTSEPEIPLMILNMADGTNQEIPLSDIKNVTFRLPSEEPVTPPEPELPKTPCFTVPTDFSKSRVLKIMADGKKIAEVCSEYILSIDAVKTVVYPVDADGKAILTKGVLAENGGSVVWNLDDNSATVTDGDDAITEFYVDEDGNFAYAIPADHEPLIATAEPDLLIDTRGSETLTYTIVKIGTQYWMAENLRAKFYADGSAITKYTGADADAWHNDTAGAYKLPGDDNAAADVYGMFYNGFAVTSENGLAPEGWEVPTTAQWNMLKKAAKNVYNLKSTTMWPTDNADLIGTDLTGFDAIPTGYYSKATGEDALLTQTYWWTSTKYYDALTRGDNLDYARITSTGKVMTVSSSALGGHSLQFGHVVRCVRR